MKNLTLLCVGVLMAAFTFAQDLTLGDSAIAQLESKLSSNFEVVAEADTSWKQGGLIGFNASQTLLNNWAAGGQSSITGTAYLNLFKNYAKGKNSWDNTLDLSYGVLNQGIVEGNNIKIDDRIDFASKYGRQAKGDWYYSALLNFRSQFAPGYEIVDGAENKDNKISDLLAPAFVLASIGMDYKPSENFTAFLSPITSKNTIVNDANSNLRSAYGFADDELDNLIRFEVGAYARFAYKRDLAPNAQYQGRLDLFSNYLNNPQNVDVNFENIIAVKLAKYFNVNFILQLVYDDDIKITQQVNDADGNQIFIDDDLDPLTPDVGQTRGVSTLQLRQVFGLGFSYKF